MKRFILSIFAVVVLSFTAKTQVYNAIGLRGSVGNYGIGPELSYHQGLGDANRAELNLAYGTDNNFSRIGVMGAFHWVGEVQSGFSWFAGPAIGGWIYSFRTSSVVGNGNLVLNSNGTIVNKTSGFGGSVGGQIGVEYDFNEDLDLPFTASLDSRPMFNFVEYYSGFEFAVGLSIRYTF
jgi:hypothetical protein